MNITEVSILLSDKPGNVRAFASFCIGCEFTVHDAKVIETERGVFVAMPSRKQTFRCEECNRASHLDAKFCHFCGIEFEPEPIIEGTEKPRQFVDVAHPVTAGARHDITDPVLTAWRAELECAKTVTGYQPNWVRYEVEFDGGKVLLKRK